MNSLLHYSKILIIIFLFFHPKNTQSQEEIPEWEYRNQARWARDFPECGGRRQSPVNIDPSKMTKVKSGKLKAPGVEIVHFEGYHRYRRSYNVTNTGRSIQFTYDGDQRTVPAIYGSGSTLGHAIPRERQRYVLEQFHFHWGQSSGVGSEHTMDGERYDMELHLVHYNRRRYGNFEAAMEARNGGVIVLAVLFEVHQKPQKRLKRLIEAVSEMSDYPMGFTTRLEVPLSLDDFLPHNDQDEGAFSNEVHEGKGFSGPETVCNFFRYSGSLTTPPCTEGITWLVAANPVAIGQRQIAAFRAIKDFHHRTATGNNFRRLQRLNGRKLRFLG